MNGMTDDRRGAMSERPSSERHTTDAPSKQSHSFYAADRQVMTVRGVTEVLSFDENGVLLVTTCGEMNLEGTGLHVTVLNTKDGIVEVTGRLCGLLYYDNDHSDEGSDKHKGKRGFFGRLLS